MAKLSNKVKRRIYMVSIAVLAVVLAGSIGALIWYAIESKQSESLYSDLQDMVDAARPSVTVPITTAPEDMPSQEVTLPEQTLPPETQPTSAWVEVTDPQTGETVQILPEYAQVYQMNNDLVGWLEIEGSDIRYPVMQTPDEPDYYLHHDFNREYSIGGCLYAEEAANVFAPSDNVTIYGHRMSDDSMFNQLLRYRNKEYFVQYPHIRFDTLRERHVYQIAFVFLTNTTLGEGFAYHNFVNAYDEYQFYNFVDQCRALSIYDTGVEVRYGDKLITLSTCEYSQTNGRFVIVAKRVG